MSSPIAPWHATCVQMPTEIIWPRDPQDARAAIDHNTSVAVEMVARAATAEPAPSLVLLPEYAVTGQPAGGTVSDWLTRGCHTVPGPLTEPFSALARERNVYIGGNNFEFDPEWPDRFFNTSWLIAPSGEVVLRYRRVHTAMWCSPHDIWDDYLTRYGIEQVWPVADTPLGRIGMIPCGEIAVPEAVRTMAVRGVEVLLHPTWEARSPGQDAATVAAAAVNGMYVISANVSASLFRGVVDNRPTLADVGSGSRIVSPIGATLAIAEHHEPTLDVHAEIDVESVRQLRSSLSMANPLLRLRVETIAETYGTSIYPPNSFLDLPLTDYSQTEKPAASAREQLDKIASA